MIILMAMKMIKMVIFVMMIKERMMMMMMMSMLMMEKKTAVVDDDDADHDGARDVGQDDNGNVRDDARDGLHCWYSEMNFGNAHRHCPDDDDVGLDAG